MTAAPHPALAPGRVAVITGGASGIGRATARALARHGLRLVLADLPGERLEAAAAEVRALARAPGDVIAVPTDVSDAAQVARLRDRAVEAYGEVAFLMNNAGFGGGGQLSGDPARWRAILETNLWGVLNGIAAFLPLLRAQGTPAAIVNTGSKQGITCPPGDTAYNISKAGVKVATEALAHDLREAGLPITAHLLIPGFTFTGITGTAEKPADAWTADQVADFLLAGMERGDFYILCPDNAVSRELDTLRMTWAMQDITQNRPALSRWHRDWKDRFAAYLQANGQ